MLIRNDAYLGFLQELGEGDPEVTRLLDALFMRLLPGSRFSDRKLGRHFLDRFSVDSEFIEFKLIRNWIKAGFANHEKWIEITDRNRIPYRFYEIRNLHDLMWKHINEDGAARRKNIQDIFNQAAVRFMSRDEMLDKGHIEISHEFNKHISFVRLLTPEALDRESFFVRNCIGHGAYDINLGWQGYEYYGLWDQRNESHASLEVVDNVVVQCKGKENKPPNGNYMPYILEAVNDKGWNVTQDYKETGMFNRNGLIYPCQRNFMPY